MNDGKAGPPSDATVVVVGAGLSGIVAARELEAAGVPSVVVLEAQDRIGGRLKPIRRPDGRVLEAGGEFTGPPQKEFQAIARELGIDSVPMPFEGKLLRVFDGHRYLEEFPLEGDPEAAADHAAAVDKLQVMIAEVPMDTPWTASHAHEWDRMTVSQWLDANVTSPAARAIFEVELMYTRDNSETSLLYMLWLQASFGGWGGYDELGEIFIGGTSQIPLRLAETLRVPPCTSVPVRRVESDDSGATVYYDGGAIRARAVIFTLQPGIVDRIQFDPPLPAAREQLQRRWLGAHGNKYFAIYDNPFWRDDGLAGSALGPLPFGLTLDLSPTDSNEGMLFTPLVLTPAVIAEYAEVLGDPAKTRQLVLDELAMYYGERALEPTEFYACEWHQDQWSTGCSMLLPMGVLSTVGPALREPVGPFYWAGADTGDQDWMEGAVTAGRRAAREVATHVL
jgi:monoamine oxidase